MEKKRMRLITITLIALLLTCTLVAQQPLRLGQGTPAVAELKAAIGLTDAQVEKLVALLKQRVESNRAALTQIAEKEGALRDTLKAGGADATAVGRLVLDIDALRKQVQASDKTYGDQARAVLDAGQLAKLKTLEDAAKLEPAIRQAIGLNLMEGTSAIAGAPMGFGVQGGPGMMMRRGAGPQ
jgi:hypothetical protein